MTSSIRLSVPLPEPLDYIDGEFVKPPGRRGLFLENPNTGEPAQEQVSSSDDAIERAIASAWRVHEEGSWSSTSLDERCGYLAALATELDQRKERIADLEAATTGAIISLTSMLQIIVSGAWHLAAAQIKGGALLQTMDGPNGHEVEVHQKPWGPALLLAPWNAPAPMAAHKAASALAAGAPAILKPTEWAPHGSDVFGEAAHAAKIPKGVFQIVHGGPDVGGRLVKDPRVKSVSFTGGLAGGQAIASACAPDFKPVQLELGGNNPVVVFDDADLDLAAQAVVALLTSLNGQWCRALGRLIVHHTRERELIDAVLAKTRALNISSSLDPASQMGPLIHSQHKKKILDQKRAYLDAGASEASDARLPDLGGHFVAPALVRGVSPASAQHEIFGPIGTVHPFRDEAEALSLANGTPYGLEGYVFTRDEARGLAFGRKIRAGGVKVNGSTMLSLNIMAPRPSWGLSGFGVEGTIETLRFFCGTRVVGVEGPMAFGN